MTHLRSIGSVIIIASLWIILNTGDAKAQLASVASHSGGTAVTNGTAYFYVVTATDTSGNESGLSAEASATPEEPVFTTVRVAAMDITVYQDGGKHYRADITVTVTDLSGNPIAGATVAGDHSYKGSANGSDSGTTAADGTVTFTSPRERAKSGDTFGFTVTGITGTIRRVRARSIADSTLSASASTSRFSRVGNRIVACPAFRKESV